MQHTPFTARKVGFRALSAALAVATACSPTKPSSSDAGAEQELLACGDEEALGLYTRRIEPLLNDTEVKSCNQCHLSGVDLGLFVRSTPCRTMSCLRELGLVDLETPERSTVLDWIRRAQPESELITQAVIDAEYDAFREWVEYHARCGDQVCPPDSGNACEEETPGPYCSTTEPAFRGFDDPGDCSDLTLENLFGDRVYRWRNRCYPCHFEADTDVPIAPKWISQGTDRTVGDRWERCWVGSLETMHTVVRNGYIDLDAPESSLLLLKPLSTEQGGVAHGGSDKFEGADDEAYVGFRDFVERYAQCAAERPDLPRPEREPAPWGTVDAGPESPIRAYCSCMLLSCHEAYHARWGDTDEKAAAGCRVDALALPVAGEDVVEGDYIECRLHYCEGADQAPDACTAAMGGDPCR